MFADMPNPNQRETENRNDRNAAERTRKSLFLNIAKTYTYKSMISAAFAALVQSRRAVKAQNSRSVEGLN